MVKRVIAQLQSRLLPLLLYSGYRGGRLHIRLRWKRSQAHSNRVFTYRLARRPPVLPGKTWSGGEGQRVRLAVAMGLASLIQRQAGISINFEVFDEPTQFLSETGIENLLECLRHRAAVLHKSIWLCDHRTLLCSNFSEIWVVRKTVQALA